MNRNIIAKRCTKCGKVLGTSNKSGLCQYHARMKCLKNKKEKINMNRNNLEDRYQKLLLFMSKNYKGTEYEKGQIDLLQQLIKGLDNKKENK